MGPNLETRKPGDGGALHSNVAQDEREEKELGLGGASFELPMGG